MLCVRSRIELYSPTRPTPAGPSSSAIALARTMLTAMFTTDEPPIDRGRLQDLAVGVPAAAAMGPAGRCQLIADGGLDGGGAR